MSAKILSRDGHDSIKVHFDVTGDNPDPFQELQQDVLEVIARATTNLMASTPYQPSASVPRTRLPSISNQACLHPKTGQIRRPRDPSPCPSSSRSSSRSSSSSEDSIRQDVTFPKLGKHKAEWGKNVDELGWVSTAKSPYGANKPKCPPCHRLKKSDPCRGPAPCKECFRKGRRTPEECQEWGENYVPKKRRVGRPKR